MYGCTSWRRCLCFVLAAAISAPALADPPVVDDQAFAVDENVPASTVVDTIVASDADLDPITFLVIGGTGQDDYAVDENSGEITVVNPPDHETDDAPTLEIEVTAGGETDTATITINVNDLPEAPVVDDQAFDLDENSAIGTSVGTVVADDVDVSAVLTYDFNPASTDFDIDMNTGEITTLVDLNFETLDQYTETVEVTDNDGLTDTATITINVNNLMEAPEVADQSFDVGEDAVIGTSVGTVAADDMDAGAVLMFAFNPASTDFAIDENTAEITTLIEFDFETLDQYTETVEVTDNDGLSDTATITINILDSGDPPVVDDQTFSIDENSAIGSTVDTVVATDPDAGAVLTYAFNPASTDFDIDMNTGEITTLVELDHEATDQYTETVEVTDNDGLTDTATITIDINDVMENPEVADQTLDIDENSAIGSTVGTVVATDMDESATIMFAFDPASTDFAIDENTGEVTTLIELDHESVDSYIEVVEVTDNDGLTDTATITIDINDVNEQPNVDDQNFNVDENEPANTVVGTVVASDPDDGDTLEFTVTGGSGDGLFSIDLNSGEITTDGPLDHEAQDSYTLDIQVDDGDLTDTATMTIAINDVNEAPIVDDQSFDIDEDAVIGSTVGTVAADDADDGDTLEYAITAESVAGVFDIDMNTGEITTLQALDFETLDQYTLTVEVTDSGTLTDDAVITIDINDVNEAPTANCIVGPLVLDSTTVCDNLITAADLDNGSSDVDAGDVLTLTIDPDGPLPVGSTNVTLTVTDLGGLTDTCVVEVQVLGADCNLNTFPDTCDLDLGVSQDCNLNEIPDECDVDQADPDGDGRFSADTVGGDGIPDECQVDTLFVDATAGGTDRTGVEWDNAYDDLQDALRIASNPANTVQTIRIADGTYFPTDPTPLNPDRDATFTLFNGRALEGGYAGRGAGNPDERDPDTFVTRLSGELGPLPILQNSRNVVRGQNVDATAVLDGLTIEFGNADSPVAVEWGGGALFLENSSPTVRDVRFVDNQTLNSGGAVLVLGGSPTFDECVFDDNEATRNGGAIFIRDADVRMSNCEFTTNYASVTGGAIQLEAGTLELLDAILDGNGVGAVNSQAGGGLNNVGGVLTMRDCQVLNNQALIAGGLSLSGGTSFVANTIVQGNQSDNRGGGVVVGRNLRNANATLVNTMIRDNIAGSSAGGVAVEGDGRLKMINCNVYANTALGGAGGLLSRAGITEVFNTILWDNVGTTGATEDDQADRTGGTLTVANSCVEGLAALAGNGNIGDDPEFINAPADLRLMLTSPCIDRGDNTALPVDTADIDGDADVAEETPQDLEGNLRRGQIVLNRVGVGVAPFVDMGVFERLDDCDGNLLNDADEIVADPSLDCNKNGIKDVCEPDCNGNGLPDDCDIDPTDPDGNGTSSEDCNANGVPDECDIAAATSEDCDTNGIPDECENDEDLDGTIDACDGCPLDPAKVDPGVCGCGVSDGDSDGDGIEDCVDTCPGNDDNLDTDGDGTPDCKDQCPTDPAKIAPGACGCNEADTDSDGDGTPDCVDNCPDDANGPQTNSDGDTVGDLCDNCPNDTNPDQLDSDGDGIGNVCDPTPFPPVEENPDNTFDPFADDASGGNAQDAPDADEDDTPPPPVGPGIGEAPATPPTTDDDQAGQDAPTVDDMMPVGCAPGCGPMGLGMLPLMFGGLLGAKWRCRRRRG